MTKEPDHEKRRQPCDLWLEDYSIDGRRLSVRRRYAAVKRNTSVDVKNIARLTKLTESTIRTIERLKIGEPITTVSLTSIIKYLSFCELDLFNIIIPIGEKEKEIQNVESESIKIEVKPHVKKNAVAVELTDFSVFYNQDTVDNAAASLGNGKNKIVVEGGNIIKVSKDKDGIVTKETLTKKWTDWIDYWSVDFDFENKREIVRVKNETTGEIEEVWTGDFIFENEWQSFRTKKERSLELKTPFHECSSGRRKIAVKVVDIFGNDTMKIIEVTVGGK